MCLEKPAASGRGEVPIREGYKLPRDEIKKQEH